MGHTVGGMGIRAVVFDIGGVLEREPPRSVLDGKWCRLLGMTEAAYAAALATVDPENLIPVGGLSEAEIRVRFAVALGLSDGQEREFWADLWDWYCGELDHDMAAFAASLRPEFATAILSNSADGARREEMSRYAFDTLVDHVIYSHEVGLAKPDPAIFALACERVGAAPGEVAFVDDTPGIVDAARAFGMHAFCNVSTPETIAAVRALLAA